jgi:hypothetical protein
MRFVVDGMFGRLARWLRIAGHDVVYVGELERGDDDSVLNVALREGRILVTGDVGLYRRGRKHGARCVLLKSGATIDQLVELSRFLGRAIPIDFERSRCPECNGELEEVNPELVRGAVPAAVLRRYRVFWKCRCCGKVYWEGSHWESIIKTIGEYERRVGKC